MKNIPNYLTVFRLVLVPVFVVVFFSDISNNSLWAFGVYALASVTDVLDGYIARKYQLITEIGIVLDPLADKVMLITAVICLYIDHRIPLIAVVVIVIKESFMILSGFILFYRKDKMVISSNIFGKMATVAITLSIVLLILIPSYKIGIYILYVAIGSKIIAFVSYMKLYREKKRGELK
jgi:cardiolipin synthase (CMP-forming)